ncbi:hypothetical protein B2J88_20305 [Rhodococcus sp. SRB_17]|uniref:hypothetical protein n=1 Tax=Acidovorax sp. SRB_24 TaxID=1962700 RepID=UPI00145CC957|nr:hypothetical protein [Acidovorax sp. SRB_24]NMM75394.1 hypothetical protein [Acidovorax sp. SRB_24]NMM86681.1 hypothetical protein [Rhodococcus sp. SRB_17]
MITLSTTHAEARAAAALQATLTALNSGATGATIDIYATVRPATGDAPGGSPLATFTLPKPAGTIADRQLTLGVVPDALIMSTGEALWARVMAGTALLFDCDVSDTTGTATLRLATTQLYAGGSVHLASGVLG